MALQTQLLSKIAFTFLTITCISVKDRNSNNQSVYSKSNLISLEKCLKAIFKMHEMCKFEILYFWINHTEIIF